MTDFKRVTLYKIKPVANYDEFLIGNNFDEVEVEEGVTGRIKYEKIHSKNKDEDEGSEEKFFHEEL